jgi:hypothetical protein
MPIFCLTILYYIMRILQSGRVTNLPQHTPKLEYCFIIFSTLKSPTSPNMMTDTIPISDDSTTHSQAASSVTFGREDLSETEITSTTHRPFCNETPTDSRGTVWYCCDCGLGPNWIGLDTGCVYCCRHSRCSSCIVDPQK